MWCSSLLFSGLSSCLGPCSLHSWGFLLSEEHLGCLKLHVPLWTTWSARLLLQDSQTVPVGLWPWVLSSQHKSSHRLCPSEWTCLHSNRTLLWTLKFEFHMIFTWHTLFDFFRSFTNVKTILAGQPCRYRSRRIYSSWNLPPLLQCLPLPGGTATLHMRLSVNKTPQVFTLKMLLEYISKMWVTEILWFFPSLTKQNGMKRRWGKGMGLFWSSPGLSRHQDGLYSGLAQRRIFGQAFGCPGVLVPEDTHESCPEICVWSAVCAAMTSFGFLGFVSHYGLGIEVSWLFCFNKQHFFISFQTNDTLTKLWSISQLFLGWFLWYRAPRSLRLRELGDTVLTQP